MELVVRPATLKDVDLLVQFNLAMAKETESLTLNVDVLAAGVRSVLADSRRGFYLLAQSGNDVAGSLMITFEWSDWRNRDWWWVQSVYVVPTHRRQGVFAAMHQAAQQRATDAGAAGLRLYVERTNQVAQRTYQARGMRRSHYDMFEQAF